MSSSTSIKRQHVWKLPSGRRKPKKKKASHYAAILRVLCPETYVGNVIGKGGLVISQIRQETGARIKVQDAVAGCLERVVVFVGSDDRAVAVKKEVKQVEGNETEDDDDDDDDAKECEENHDDGKVESKTSSVQNALLRIFDKMIEGEKEVKKCDYGSDKSYATSVRLVVFSSQADCLKRRGGGTFEEMSSESGAHICFLSNDKRPACISASDELVQITGEINGIKKGIISVTHQLLENPPQNSEISQQKLPGLSSSSAGQAQTARAEAYRNNADYQSAKMSNDIIKMSFRLLCPEKKAGAVIGRGGSIVKGLQQDTGCEIDVADRNFDVDERIIAIAGPAHPEDRISPAQDGVLRVQARIIKCPPESKEPTATARLLVPSNQISALLGKGGTILSEIRKLSRAQVQILGKEQLPRHVSANDDVVQVNGEFEAVQEALLHITAQLQRQFFHSYVERRGAFLGGLPPPPPPHGNFYSNDEPSPFMHNIQRLGVPLHILERNPSPAPWRPEGLINGVGHMGMPDYVGDPLRRLPGGINPAIITSTTVEVVVPSSVIPSIYGEGGGCLQQIIQISDAAITIAKPKAGATETMITISGTPEQTNAAQSLIQAFVISETQSS
uniref:K Homology domain-containing protein n=1 Tax=Kalanchoe fedtschenkoi TaxID=63787 RepID=A0A7N0UVQ9_KALFE